ncbi:hypothetical protein IT568_01455 [bacterium]|nr:hypothetical protein [bacterium]
MSIGKKLLIGIFALSPLNALYSAEINYVGSYDMRNISSGRTLGKGVFTFGMDIKGYDAGNQYSTIIGRWLFNYGITDNFALSIVPIFYEDFNFSQKPITRAEQYNLPGNTSIGIKYGWHFMDGKLDLSTGFLLGVTTGQVQNVVFEPYEANAYSGELRVAGTFNLDEENIAVSPKIHLNLAYKNHNDAGENTATDEILYGLGVEYSINTQWKVGLEIYGNQYITKPPKDVYNGVKFQRSNYLYIAPRVDYVNSDWMKFFLSFDIRAVVGADKEFVYDKKTFDTYPSIRGVIGMEISSGPSDFSKSKYLNPDDLIEKVIKGQDLMETEDELEVIRQERIRAEKELEELKKMLEEKDK